MSKSEPNILAGALDAAGAQYHPDADATPSSFGAPDQEYRVLLDEVGLVDLSDRGLLSIAGDDRTTWLHGLCTQDIAKLGELEGAYACHIDIKGRIIADFRAVNLGDFLLLDTEPGMTRVLRRALKHYVVMEKIKVRERDAVTGQLGLVGPLAVAALERVIGGRGALDGLPMHGARAVDVGDLEVLTVKTDQFGVEGLRLAAQRDQLAALWAALSVHVRPAGRDALERVRIRKGRGRFGADFGEDVLFNEAGLDDAVSFTKGCYLGQEVVERVDSRQRAQRRLVPVRFDGDRSSLPAAGAKLALDGKEIGRVTSSVWAPDLEAGVGLALLGKAALADGTALGVLVDGDPAGSAVVVREVP